ncbi:uncharacterized protein LOC122711233 [Apis laboriosa]|uniref:uncharacterized protein LOC122711233 n=1 Tax=Apis laboriosa TaxID=183418 RepID=UPI001CC55301|nr:uncharacterized protein LOC122711233 [Apis laboriosa]
MYRRTFLSLCAIFLSFVPVSIAQNGQDHRADVAVVAVSASPEDRPYRFAINIVDFQHKHENKDADGIITREYGFVTVDGMYHEVPSLKRDKNDNFVVTRRYKRIKILKDTQGILKNGAKGGRKLKEAITRACRRIAGKDKAGDVAGTRNTIAKPSTSDPLLGRMRGALMEKERDDGSSREWNKSFLKIREGRLMRNVIDPATRNSTKKREKKFISRERNSSESVAGDHVNDRRNSE